MAKPPPVPENLSSSPPFTPMSSPLFISTPSKKRPFLVFKTPRAIKITVSCLLDNHPSFNRPGLRSGRNRIGAYPRRHSLASSGVALPKCKQIRSMLSLPFASLIVVHDLREINLPATRDQQLPSLSHFLLIPRRGSSFPGAACKIRQLEHLPVLSWLRQPSWRLCPTQLLNVPVR